MQACEGKSEEEKGRRSRGEGGSSSREEGRRRESPWSQEGQDRCHRCRNVESQGKGGEGGEDQTRTFARQQIRSRGQEISQGLLDLREASVLVSTLITDVYWFVLTTVDGIRTYWDGESKVYSRTGNSFRAPQWFIDRQSHSHVLRFPPSLFGAVRAVTNPVTESA